MMKEKKRLLPLLWLMKAQSPPIGERHWAVAE